MRIVKLTVALAMASAVVAAAPAGAAQFAYCDPLAPAGTALYPDGGGAARAAIAGRGGTLREPDLGQVATDLPASAKGKAGKRFSATVPVYFHVITAGSVGNLTAAQIAAQMDVLNTEFAGAEGGAVSGFTFRLAGVTRTDNAAWFDAKPGGIAEHSMKRALHQGGTNALNLYSGTAGDFLGWSYLPDILTKPGQQYLDGVVFDWESAPGVSATYAGQFDEGKTVTHEVGHWLNLEHTFYGGCGDKGDFVADTPPEKTPTSGCPAGKDTCAAPGLDPIHNYMDYSYDSCYSEFTAGQVQRMRDAWLFYRAGG
jgi:Pregnancy-associated plasma protein-A